MQNDDQDTTAENCLRTGGGEGRYNFSSDTARCNSGGTVEYMLHPDFSWGEAFLFVYWEDTHGKH